MSGISRSSISKKLPRSIITTLTKKSTHKTYSINDDNVMTIFFKCISSIKNGESISDLKRNIDELQKDISPLHRDTLTSRVSSDVYTAIDSISTKAKGNKENEEVKNDAIDEFVPLFIVYYIKPYLSKDKDGRFDFLETNTKFYYRSFLKKIYYIILKNKSIIDTLNILYKLLFFMEQDGVTGIIDLNSGNALSLDDDVIKFISETNLTDHIADKKITHLSNTFLYNLIEFLKKKVSQKGGKKIHIGPKGGKYTISVKNGKKIKKYIK